MPLRTGADRRRIAKNEPPRDRPRATPFARRIDREHGIQNVLAGPEPRGQIARQDVEAAVSKRTRVVPDSAQPLEPDIAKLELPERIRLETTRRLSEFNDLVPHLHLAFDIRIRKLVELRNELNLLRSNFESG